MVGAANVLQVVINGVNGTGPAFRGVSMGAAAMATAVAGSFAFAIHRASQFERGVAEIGTLLDGDVGPAVAGMRRELMDLSVQFGQSIQTMTKARYDIVSAGFSDAADSAMVLRESARLAVAGVSTVAETADLLTTAINGLGLSAKDASRVADVLFQTVRKGKTTMSQLSSAFGPVFATARVAGVEIEELAAVMASLTVKGVATAEAATALNALLRAIAAPTAEAAKAMDAMGISLNRGLMPALRGLATVGEEGLRALAEFIPNIEALKAASVAASDINALAVNMDAMANSTGQVNRAVGMMADTFGFKMDQFKAAMDNVVITVGTALLPTAKQIIGVMLEIAVTIRYLSTEADDGKLRWVSFIEELRKSSPVFDTIARSAEWLAARIADIGKNAEVKDFNDRVTAKMKEIMASGEMPQKPGLFGWDDDLVALRSWAEEIVRLEDEMKPKPESKNVVEDLRDRVRAAYPELAEWLAQLRQDVAGLMSPASSPGVNQSHVITSGFGQQEKQEPFGPPSDLAAKKKKGKSKTAKEAKTDAQLLQEQIAEMAQFTRLDFAEMAFAVGDSFGSIIGDIGQQMLGLREGPLMVGRAFKQMAAQVLSDLGRIIARMLAARALMSLFGIALGAATGGGAAVARGGGTEVVGFQYAKDGLRVPRAAGGHAVSGSLFSDFPPIILPGSPGLDRTPVLAAGGELLISRQRVNQAEHMLKKVKTSPRGASGGRGGRTKVELNVQANRPFRTTEQIALRDSVLQGIARGRRYSA
jgi:TP901 family phage tail tape measure protein